MEPIWMSKGDGPVLVNDRQKSTFENLGYKPCDAPPKAEAPKPSASKSPGPRFLGEKIFAKKGDTVVATTARQFPKLEALGYELVTEGVPNGEQLEQHGRSLDQERREPQDGGQSVEQPEREQQLASDSGDLAEAGERGQSEGGVSKPTSTKSKK